MAPPRRVSVGERLGAAQADLAQGSADKLLRARDEQAGAADLAHGGGHQVADDELDVDALRLQLRGQSATPVLQEGLAATVGGEIRGGHDAGKGAHGQDETPLAPHQKRGNNLCGLEGAEAVERDDVLELLAAGLEERNGDAVRLSDVVDQDAHVQTPNQRGEALVVVILVLGVVHRQYLDLQPGPSQLQFAGESFELGFGAGNEDQVETLGGELLGKLLAETVGCAGDDGPGALPAILAELRRTLVSILNREKMVESGRRDVRWCR